MVWIGNTKSRLCVGCSLFFVLIGGSLLQDRIEPNVAPLIVFPAGLLIYFLSWIIYKYTIGRIVVMLSAISLILLILVMFLL